LNTEAGAADPSGEELQKVAAKVAADLSVLVNANRLSLAQ